MENKFEHKYPIENLHELDLSWFIKNVQELLPRVDSLEDWKRTHEEQYAELLALYQEVKADWDRFAAGDFPASTYEAMKRWWEANAVDLVGSLVKFVFFGLTLDGYFVAYIPENWDEINFDTIMTPGEDFGKLCILY